MNYSAIRNTIRSGDLITQSHRSSMLASWYDFKIALVRFITRSEFSHVGVAWVVAGRVFILEAVSSGVRIFPVSRIGEFYLLPLNVTWTDAIEQYAMTHVGDRYSQLEAIQAYFGPVDETNDVWECAEYVLHVLKRAGIDLGNCATPTGIVRSAQLQGAACSLICNP